MCLFKTRHTLKKEMPEKGRRDTPAHTQYKPCMPAPLTHTCCAAHASSPETLLTQAEAACRRAGLNLTAQRRAVLALLYAQTGPLGAYELIERLGETTGRKPAPTIIYRALDFLCTYGFVHRLESVNAFVACTHQHPAGEKLVFLICETCRHVDEIIAESTTAALGALTRERGFLPHRQVIEISGRCRSCSEQAGQALP